MILDEIIAHKKTEITALRARFDNWSPPQQPPLRRDFLAALRRPGLSLIAEFKRRSPSRGDIHAQADPAHIARLYSTAGAAALSVLTDQSYFGGSLDDLATVRRTSSLPILRKDFLLDELQLAESCLVNGPDAVLLIAAALDITRLRRLRQFAAACGQAALVEVHNERELDAALESGAQLIGINNRDLATFTVSLETTLRLRPLVPSEIPVVAESGIHTRQDVLLLEQAGVDAMLVGEALMSAPDPAAKIEELLDLS